MVVDVMVVDEGMRCRMKPSLDTLAECGSLSVEELLKFECLCTGFTASNPFHLERTLQGLDLLLKLHKVAFFQLILVPFSAMPAMPPGMCSLTVVG